MLFIVLYYFGDLSLQILREDRRQPGPVDAVPCQQDHGRQLPALLREHAILGAMRPRRDGVQDL